MISLFLDSVSDANIRDVFKKITNYLEGRAFLKGEWQFVEITIRNGVPLLYPHQLKTRPKDIIVTSVTGPGTIAWDLDKSTTTAIKVTASSATINSPVVIRAFIGIGGK